MNLFTNTLALLLALLVSSAAHATSRICGPHLLSQLPKFETALNNLNSFTYVRAALEEALRANPKAEYCVSAVAVGNNIYQYQKYLIQVEVAKPDSKPSAQFRFLFQDASVQAFHGIAGQPWTGLNPKRVDEVINELIGATYFSEVPRAAAKASAVDVARMSRQYTNNIDSIDLDTVSSIELYNGISLVTWLSKPADNPFLRPIVASGVLVRLDARGVWHMAENFSIASDILFKLEDDITFTTRSLKPDHSDWKQKLLAFSK